MIKAIEFDFPGNSDAQALLFEEIETTAETQEKKPQQAAFVDVLSGTNSELNTNKTASNSKPVNAESEQLEEDENKDEPVELLLDFVENKGTVWKIESDGQK